MAVPMAAIAPDVWVPAATGLAVGLVPLAVVLVTNRGGRGNLRDERRLDAYQRALELAQERSHDVRIGRSTEEERHLQLTQALNAAYMYGAQRDKPLLDTMLTVTEALDHAQRDPSCPGDVEAARFMKFESTRRQMRHAFAREGLR